MAVNEQNMTAIDLARQLSELGDGATALKLYTAALTEPGTQAVDRLEAACAVLQYGEDYTIAYDAFLDLYRENEVRCDAFAILTDAFYTPNKKQQEKRYKKNCKLLKDYPYLFQKDFLAFEELPIRFYPYDDDGVLPFYINGERFDAYTNINDPVIAHYFFRDLEKPVFAENVFSQYELEYLKDNVRRSDWVGRENHIYLHYADWGVFCAWLQLLDMKPLLEDEKFVFLIGDEKDLYPIDFKERFGIDYSQYPVKPLHIREINKLIWHTQFSTHNGGDFFNEILHGHPNLIGEGSIMMYTLADVAAEFVPEARKIHASKGTIGWSEAATNIFDKSILLQLSSLKDATEKDAVVAFYLGMKDRFNQFYDRNARIVPALLIQPHFHHAHYYWSFHESNRIAVKSENYRKILDSGILHQFKYVKTFTPMRRPTTSHAATMRIMDTGFSDETYDTVSKETGKIVMPISSDNVITTILNRNMMIAETDRLYKDSRLVRFEDAKLNPAATFTALAEFLDIPYTESMTYCSDDSGRDPLEFATNVRGFDPAPVFRTYDEFADRYERTLIEYLMRDIYQAYGYGFQYYDGKEMTQEDVEALLEQCVTNHRYIEKSFWECRERFQEAYKIPPDEIDDYISGRIAADLAESKELRLLTARILSHGLNFCNEDGEPLHLMPMLEPVPGLLAQPLYR